MKIYSIDENEIEEAVEKVAKDVILDKTRTMEMAKKFILEQRVKFLVV